MKNTITRFINGDQNAFKRIYEMFYRSLCSYGYRVTGEVESVNDIVQETFLSLWHKRTEFQSIDSVRYFLYATTRNKCLNFIKHQKVVENYQNTFSGKDEYENFESSSLELIIEEEVRRQLMEAVASLPESYRKVIILSLKDKQNQEIARILGLSVNTVRNQKQKGYSILRKKLGSNFYFLQYFFLIAEWYN